jgi:hypothetical protein
VVEVSSGIIQETIIEEVGTRGRGPAGPGTSWGAIWAGFFVTLGVETLFTLLMIGIFASFVHPGGGSPSGLSFGIGIAIWFFLQTIGAYYAGGWVAGMLARRAESGRSSLHGWAVWGLSTVVIVYLLAAAAGPSYTGTLNNVRMGLGMAQTTTATAFNGGGTVPVGNTVAGIGRGVRYAATAGNVGLATWIPIFLFITFGCSLGGALAGGALGASGVRE